MGVSIGTVAYILKVSESSLKKWQRDGLIASPPRTATNRRSYSEADIEAIRQFIESRQTKDTH